MKRRCLLILAAILAGFAVWWVLSEPSCPITKENYERIKEGMTKNEVVAILGPRREIPPGKMPLISKDHNYPEYWFGEEHFITVQFGPDDTVCEKYFGKYRDFGETFFDKIRRWVGI